MTNIFARLTRNLHNLTYDYCRVGLKRAITSRPVKISLYSSDMAAKEWDIHINNNALIFPDRPVEERRAFKRISAQRN